VSWYIPVLAIHVIFFIVGLALNIVGEHKFSSTLGQKRIKELQHVGVIKLVLLNPWWIFPYVIFMPFMGIALLILGWNTSLNVIIQGSIVATKKKGITKEDIVKLEKALDMKFEVPGSN
jgi:hypothetical protein